MSQYIRQAGEWKQVLSKFIRRGGEWTRINSSYVRQGGEWKSILQGALGTAEMFLTEFSNALVYRAGWGPNFAGSTIDPDPFLLLDRWELTSLTFSRVYLGGQESLIFQWDVPFDEEEIVNTVDSVRVVDLGDNSFQDYSMADADISAAEPSGQYWTWEASPGITANSSIRVEFT